MLITFVNIRPDKMSGLNWIQTVWHSNGIFTIPEITFRKKRWFWKNQQTTKCMKNFPACKKLNPLSLGKPRFNCGRLNMCDLVCENMSHAKLSLHWSVIHYQVAFEWHSGCGSKTSIGIIKATCTLSFQQLSSSQLILSCKCNFKKFHASFCLNSIPNIHNVIC